MTTSHPSCTRPSNDGGQLFLFLFLAFLVFLNVPGMLLVALVNDLFGESLSTTTLWIASPIASLCLWGIACIVLEEGGTLVYFLSCFVLMGLWLLAHYWLGLDFPERWADFYFG